MIKNKVVLAFITAFLAVCNAVPCNAFADEQDDITWYTTEVTTTTTTTAKPDEELNDEPYEEIFADEPVSEEEFAEVKEKLENLLVMFEENDYDIDGITENVDGINGEIDGLQMSLDDIYSMISSLQQTNNNSTGQTLSGGNSASNASPERIPIQTTVTSEKESQTTTTTTTTEETTTSTIVPDTTPNGYLIEKAEKYPEERDFITVTTRDGHVFYIVIDYEDENQRVYFLNTVDTADLKRLLETGTTTAVQEEESVPKTVATESADVEKNATTQKKPEKKNNTLLYVGLGIMGLILIIVAKKKLSGSKNTVNEDEDEDNSDNEEFVQEDYVNESEEQ